VIEVISINIWSGIHSKYMLIKPCGTTSPLDYRKGSTPREYEVSGAELEDI